MLYLFLVFPIAGILITQYVPEFLEQNAEYQAADSLTQSFDSLLMQGDTLLALENVGQSSARCPLA